jgi:hypothetical protein
MSELLPRSRHLARAREIVPIGVGVCLALLVIGLFVGGQSGRDQFFGSWLFAWLFWFGLSLGCMGVVMMHHLFGGGWGYLVRRFGEAAALCVPVMAILFIPVVLGVRHIYPWAVPSMVADDPVLQHKAPYLHFSFWALRAVGYFAVFWLLAWRLRANSLQLDRGPNPRVLKRLVNLSSIGEVIYFVLMSLAAIDWIMSREPRWVSSVFGFIVVISQALTALCFLTLMVALYADDPALKDAIQPDYLNDLGNVLLTFVILWAYLSFAQFIVTWLGNSQDEITWYIRRTDGGWRWVGGALMFLHFLVPFFLLLMRPLKRKIGRLALIAGGLMFMRVIDVLYWVTPSEFPHEGAWGAMHYFYAEAMNILAWLGIGGIWFLAFLWFLKDRPILPIGDFIPVTPVDHGHGQRPVPATVE